MDDQRTFHGPKAFRHLILAFEQGQRPSFPCGVLLP
jgi:hypothetical protein